MASWRALPFRFIGICLLLVGVTFGAGYLLAVRWLFPPLPEPKNGIVVPKLAGLTVAAAEAELRKLGLRVSETIEIAHATQPAGIIIAQSPLAGQQLRAAGSVQLGVSAAAVRLPAPTPALPRDSAPAPDTIPIPLDTIAADTIR